MRRFLRRALLVLLVLFAAIQLVPYGRSHENPPERSEPKWDSPRTRELAARVCFDCHSNETRWPWYSHVAPASWLLQRDVEEAREHLNFSEFSREQRHADEAAHEYEEGEMPPWFYLPLHGEARLGDSERRELIEGLKRTFSED